MDNSVEKTVVTAYYEALKESQDYDSKLTHAMEYRLQVEKDLQVAKSDERLAAERMQASANKVDTFLNFIKLQGWKV